jgi:hypothetical protein
LVFTNFFHPVNGLTIELLLDGNMSHSGCGSGPMPLLFTRRKPDYISRPNFLDRFAIALNPAAASRDNESLTQRMRVPRSACARLKRNADTLNTCWGRCLKKRIDPYGASKPVRWPPLLEACVPILLISILVSLNANVYNVLLP